MAGTDATTRLITVLSPFDLPNVDPASNSRQSLPKHLGNSIHFMRGMKILTMQISMPVAGMRQQGSGVERAKPARSSPAECLTRLL